ncbi:excinuclease ABC subunit A [bacterium]|nr:excinuclease ABC subunit A [bacterium]
MDSSIHIKGARTHNLKDVEVLLPRHRLTVITGVSGSGKSSLAFDTLHAEGSRQYLESLSAKARGMMDAVARPDVDFIRGLSPVIAIAQRTGGNTNPRSTVATLTEIADHVRPLWIVAGERSCLKDGHPVRRRSLDDNLLALGKIPAGTRLLVAAPVAKDKPSVLLETVADLGRRGFSRVRLDGKVATLDEATGLLTGREARQLDVVVDRIVAGEDQRSRLADSLELAFKEGRHRALVLADDGQGGWTEHALSLHLACEHCGTTYEPIAPKALSHNHPDGACPDCGGLGRQMRFQEGLAIQDDALSLQDGVVKPWKLGTRKVLIHRNAVLRALAEQVSFDLRRPWRELPEATRRLLLHGDPQRKFLLPPPKGRKPVETTWTGMFPALEQAYRTTTGESLRQRLLQYQAGSVCAACQGRRLSPTALSLRLDGLDLAQFLRLTIPEALAFSRRLAAHPRVQPIEEARRGLEQRLAFLHEAGLNYLTLEREAATLSGGEAQRVRLATQLGLGLVGVTYVLDEPSIGLHPADHLRLIRSIHGLRDLGNTVVVVERAYLSGRADLSACLKPKAPGKKFLTIRGATENNLKQVDARFPLGNLTVVCGVSGSGKSTLAIDVLSAAAARKINGAKVVPGRHAGLEGLDQFQAFTAVDQEPIGRTPRSNPATFTGIMDLLRDLWSALPLAKARGYGAGRFSFNVRGGRCETCAGEGSVALDMQFLGEAFVECPSCAGRRFNRETLEVRFKGLSIAEALELTVKDAAEFFRAQPRLAEKLRMLEEVGLGYLKLGQPANTLSGGEAQRLKLAAELARRDHTGRLYVLDEPTTGLHWDDIAKLLALLGRLRDAGATLIVIEHHPDVIRAADWVLELGPEGGAQGGQLVYEGAPAGLLKHPGSPTGQALSRP